MVSTLSLNSIFFGGLDNKALTKFTIRRIIAIVENTAIKLERYVIRFSNILIIFCFQSRFHLLTPVINLLTPEPIF